MECCFLVEQPEQHLHRQRYYFLNGMCCLIWMKGHLLGLFVEVDSTTRLMKTNAERFLCSFCHQSMKLSFTASLVYRLSTSLK